MNNHDYRNDFHRREVPNLGNLMANDPQLCNFEKDIRKRYAIFENTKRSIEEAEGLERFTQGYKEFGVFVRPDGGVMCREWIPNAKTVYLSGEFNNWEKWMYERKAYGKWEIFINSDADGLCVIRHLSELKLCIETQDGQILPRISPWAKYVVRRDDGNAFRWLFWNPPRNEAILPMNLRPPKPLRLRIYEAHIGIASSSSSVSSYRYFTEEVLPRIRDLGYNCVLLMAIMEHPVYSSVGYNVSNYFASSSRFGTPNDLKKLIDVAHGMGMTVMIDVTHSRASNHPDVGLSMLDGTQDCYFEKSSHEKGRTPRFNVAKWEVLRYLLSNLRYYMEEFNLDGFRFNEVTRMLYHNPEENSRYSNDYRQYFGMHMDTNAIAYLMLANDMIHGYYPTAVTVAEDTSEMPTLCRPVREGGIGFDYKLGLSVPNKWMKLLEECRDENWNMGFIFHALTEKRNGEKVIACTESRQQNLFEKKTLISKLVGQELQDNMSDEIPLTIGIDRGLSLHKMMRLITQTLAGDSYLNFMGNEFGHPDYVEFPSSSNSYSYYYARRRYELCDDEDLRFKYLMRFDRAMNNLEEKFGWLMAPPAYVSRKHEGNKVFIYERAHLLFLFNFHPTQSYPDYQIGVNESGVYKIILDTDDPYFGGHGRSQHSVDFETRPERYDNRNNSVMVYLPSRTGMVMVNHEQDDGIGRIVSSGMEQEVFTSTSMIACFQ